MAIISFATPSFSHAILNRLGTTAMDMTGKVCLVTGTSSGIGKETATALAQLGATVLAVARSEPRGRQAVEEISRRSDNPDVRLVLCDLSSRASIRAAAVSVRDHCSSIDVLINQAGLYTHERRLTVDGEELMFAVNHLAYFQLTLSVLDLILEDPPGRIVNGTGATERLGRIHLDDLSGERQFRPFRALAQSKLANVLFTYELARRLSGTGVTANCYHPGATRTDLGVGAGGWFGLAMKLVRLTAQQAEQAARAPVRLASDPALAAVTGQYFARSKPAKSSKLSADRDLALRLWHTSARLTGVDYPRQAETRNDEKLR